MNRSERMKSVRRYTASREDEAARAFEEANLAYRQQQQQLDELRRYREEYRSQMMDVGASGVSASRFNQFRGFLAKLDEAIKQQEQTLAQVGQECARRRQVWLEARAKTQIMDKVVSRCQDEEARSEARAEQKAVDEMAQYHGRNGPGRGGRR